MGVTTLAAMPGTKRLAASLALLAAVAALSGCGSDEVSGEIPAEDALALNEALDGVSASIEADCDQAQEYAQDFVDAVNELPQDPSGELKPELQNAGDHLRTLVATECAAEPPATTQSTTTTTTSTPTETSTTETSTTDTSTTETSTSTTTSTDETTPPGNGNGGGPPDGGPPGNDGTGGTGSDKGGK